MSENGASQRRPQSSRKGRLLCVFISLAFIAIQLVLTHVVSKESDQHLDKDFGPPETKASYLTSTIDELLQHSEASSASLRTIINSLKNHTPPGLHGEEITDIEGETKRCESYGFKYAGRRTRRRVFYGSNIADDSWHTIAAHAMESFGLYHTVALVESNVTHMRTPRNLRFKADSLNVRAMQSGIFGPTTDVFVDQYIDTGKPINTTGDPYGLINEDLQRELVLERWIKQGMTTDDLGLIGDVDEIFSRDFLLAAMTCDVPQFRTGQDCKKPKLAPKTLIFEMAPDCITEGRHWYHPDMISGECIDGVGDSNTHPQAERVMGVGFRFKGYGRENDDYQHLPINSTMFPLFKPSDTRMKPVSHQISKRGSHSAFHLHNYFRSTKDIRHKYWTYTHGYEGSEKKVPLGEFHEDIDLAVRCFTNRKDKHLPYVRKKGGFDSIDGLLQPLAFQNEEYRKQRFEEMKQEILKDEAVYSSFEGTYHLKTG